MVFILVRWLGEETLSVLTAKAARKGQQTYVGAYIETTSLVLNTKKGKIAN